jgi:hypothetical protein
MTERDFLRFSISIKPYLTVSSVIAFSVWVILACLSLFAAPRFFPAALAKAVHTEQTSATLFCPVISRADTELRGVNYEAL